MTAQSFAPPPSPESSSGPTSSSEAYSPPLNTDETILRIFSRLGSNQTSTWKPHHSLHAPPSPHELSISTLMAAGAHLGHNPAHASPAFLPYTYGTRSGLSIIDLEQTLPLLRRAANVTRAIAEADGLVLFVGTGDRDGALGAATRKAAKRLGSNGYHIDTRWLPGLLTNPFEVLGGRAASEMNVKPDLVIFLNPLENIKAIRECGLALVPTIGIVDSNVDPRIVMYPIPANDESTRTAELIAGTLSMAGREGVMKRLERERIAKEQEEAEREREERRQKVEQRIQEELAAA